MVNLLLGAFLLAPPKVELLEGARFKADFNADKGFVRVLVILAPSCVTCLNGAREMQEQVLAKVQDPRIKAYIVWTNAYGTDDPALAKQGAQFVHDKRARNYWDAKTEISLDFGRVVKVPRDAPLAYDVYYLYRPGALYGEAAPEPVDYWHQILEDKRFFEPEAFRKRLASELKQNKTS